MIFRLYNGILTSVSCKNRAARLCFYVILFTTYDVDLIHESMRIYFFPFFERAVVINCKQRAIFECVLSDFRHAVGELYFRERAAIFESFFADFRHTIRYSYRFKRAAIVKLTIADARYAIGYSYRLK